MNRPRDVVRQLLSLGLAVILLTLSVATPVLDRGEDFGRVSVESTHDPSRCGHPHDHRICTQMGANLSLAAPVYDYRTPHVTLRSARPEAPAPEARATFVEGPPSRAPPLA